MGKVDRALTRGAVARAVSGAGDPVETVRAATGGYGADSIVITASSPTAEPLELAGELARDRARVSVVGLLPLEIPRKTYYEKELEVTWSSRSYGPGRYDADYEERGYVFTLGYVRWTERRNLQAVLRAHRDQAARREGLITHRFPFGKRPRRVRAHHRRAPRAAPRRAAHLPARRCGLPSPPRATASSPHEVAGASSRVAVVGTGSFATTVLLPALDKTPGARLVSAVSGRGHQRPPHASDKFGADGVASSIDDVLAMPDVEALIIATRHDSHAALAARALRAGRDVLLEEACGGRRAAARRAGRSGPQLERAPARWVQPSLRTGCAGAARFFRTEEHRPGDDRAHQRRKDPGGELGRGRRRGGGRIVGEACHFIDLFSLLGRGVAGASQYAHHRAGRRHQGPSGQRRHQAEPSPTGAWARSRMWRWAIRASARSATR